MTSSPVPRGCSVLTGTGWSRRGPRDGRGSLEFVLVVLVAGLGFLVASFPARNSDVWLHLASGRRIAQGNLTLAAVGDNVGTTGATHTWLSDLLGYGLYRALGGMGLALAKAVMVAGLALLLLRLSWDGHGWWIPAACTALALLAMSTRLLLQPATVSYFLLALTLWALRPGVGPVGETAAERPTTALPHPWALPVLFIAWVNLDGWFVLGLAVVALVMLGHVLDQVWQGDGQRSAAAPLSPAGRALVALCLLAGVCLLNPLGVRAFALPPEVAWLGGSGASSVQATAGQVASPFRQSYFAAIGLTPASLAYFPLLALSLLSFLVNLRFWRWQWFLPWLGVALLSAGQARAIPFFAVVAGPVLAWNAQAALARRFGRPPVEDPVAQRAFLFGRIVTGALCLGLLVCAWPGWLQGPPFEPRRWAVEAAPSIERGAAMARLWHDDGKLGPDSRALHLSRETANAFAWFCPQESGLLDAGLASTIRAGRTADSDADEAFRAAGITHVILYDADIGRLLPTLDRLLLQPARWPLLHAEGDLAIFGWRDPAGDPDRFRGWEQDPDQLAFHPGADKKAPPQPSEADAQARAAWEAFWKPAPPRRIDYDDAKLCLFRVDAAQRSAPARHLAAWEATQWACVLGAAAGSTGPAGPLQASVCLGLLRPPLPAPDAARGGTPSLASLALARRQWFTIQRDDAPPALLYLAVRAARRALLADPGDARAQALLGESYLRFMLNTRERAWAGQLSQLRQLRQAQASAALNRAVSLRPDLPEAHLNLATLYGQMGYLDLAVHHERASLKLSRAEGPPPGSDPERFWENQARAEEALSQRARTVEAQENDYAVEASDLPVLDRAMLAFRKGLAGKARDVLLGSDVAGFGRQGTALELTLLLHTGRPQNVQEWMAPEQQGALGTPSYHWLRTQALAASGNYSLAKEECRELAQPATASLPNLEATSLRPYLGRLIGQAILDELPGGVPQLLRQPFRRQEFRNRAEGVVRILQQQANATVLRGVLALEEGDVDEARAAFRAALTLWQGEPAAASGNGLDFGGRAVALGLLAWLE